MGVSHLMVVTTYAGPRLAGLATASLPFIMLDLCILVEGGLTRIFLIMALTLLLFFHRTMLLDQLVYFGFPQGVKVRVSKAVDSGKSFIGVKC